MNRNRILCALCLVALSFHGDESFARGGRGGGGGGGFRGGGGGFSGGGYGGGGFSAGGGYRGGGASYAPSVNRSPSMSHVPSAPRSAQMPARPAAPSLGGGRQTPIAGAAGGQRASAAARPAAPASGGAAFRTPSSFNRPTQSQVGSFLNLPTDSRAGATSARSAPPVASTLPGSGPRTIETARGGTITVGGQGGSSQIGGATVGGAVGGIKVETAGGNTFGKVGGAVGVSDGSNAAIRGGSVSGGQGARGSFVNVSRGYADTAGNRAGGSVTAAQGRFGYTAVNVRGGYGQGGTGQIGSVTAVRGPGGNVVSTGRGASFVNGQFVGGQNWAAVNGAYTRWNYFTPGWRAQYPGAWWPGKWAVRTTAWAIATWPYASAYCACEGEPTYYDYGGNVAYEDGTVYADDQPVATAEEYYAQAEQNAKSGAESQNEDWLSLGVFAVIAEEGQTHTDKVVQLALNREGAIRGNFQDMLTDKVTPVTGAVDKATQRVSLKAEGNDSLIVETGLYNLTNDEVPVLVHFGPDRQEGRVLIRLKQPEAATTK